MIIMHVFIPKTSCSGRQLDVRCARKGRSPPLLVIFLTRNGRGGVQSPHRIRSGSKGTHRLGKRANPKRRGRSRQLAAQIENAGDQLRAQAAAPSYGGKRLNFCPPEETDSGGRDRCASRSCISSPASRLGRSAQRIVSTSVCTAAFSDQSASLRAGRTNRKQIRNEKIPYRGC
jgi:hypothetical protein